jgi:hypothetical protein
MHQEAEAAPPVTFENLPFMHKVQDVLAAANAA